MEFKIKPYRINMRINRMLHTSHKSNFDRMTIGTPTHTKRLFNEAIFIYHDVVFNCL